jgi:hypothetical protein
MIDPKFECAMCKRDLLDTQGFVKHIFIENKMNVICKYCNNKYTPDEIKSVTLTAELCNKTITKEYNLGLFLINQFTEKDIREYTEDNKKLTRYLRKILDIKKDDYVNFKLKINTIKKRCNKCEVCDKLLDFEDSIYFLEGKAKYIQVCYLCHNKSVYK